MSVQTATTTPQTTTQPQGDDKVGRKVFIGNLAYTATEEQVREFVSGAGGKLESLELATRSNGRAAGYAFAVWSSSTEAEEAVQKLDKKLLQEREISVAIAKARSDKPRGRKVDESKQVQKDEEGVVIEASGSGEAADGNKKKRNQRKKRSARRLPADDNDDVEQVDGQVQAEEDSPKKSKAKRNRKPKFKANKAEGEAPTDGPAESARIDDDNNAQQQTQNQQTANVGNKRTRQPRVATTGQPSATLVFVANLPFSVGDEQLAEVFNSLSIGIKSAKVITKPGFRKKGGDEAATAPAPRSKGFGFVETNNQDQQKLALEKLQGYKIDDREIVVKVANERQAVDENVEVKAEGDSN